MHGQDDTMCVNANPVWMTCAGVVEHASDHLVTICYIKEYIVCFGIHDDLARCQLSLTPPHWALQIQGKRNTSHCNVFLSVSTKINSFSDSNESKNVVRMGRSPSEVIPTLNLLFLHEHNASPKFWAAQKNNLCAAPPRVVGFLFSQDPPLDDHLVWWAREWSRYALQYASLDTANA